MRENSLVVAALPQLVEYFPSTDDQLITGIGQVNAAAALGLHLATARRPELIVNVGVVGSVRDFGTEPVAATSVEQRYSARSWPSDLVAYVEPAKYVLENPFGLPEVSLSTGDDFVEVTSGLTVDAVDMEAYALAHAAAMWAVPFVAVKISADHADADSMGDLLATLDACARRLGQWRASLG